MTVFLKTTLVVCGTFLALWGIRALGPSDLLDNDQERPASYAMDAVVHGRWICQVDTDGDITSKPPMFTWIAAAALSAWGKPALVALLLPSSLALLLSAVVAMRLGGRAFGTLAGGWAAIVLLVSMTGFKDIWLCRTDTLFAALTFATAAAAWNAATGRGSWWTFWIVAALATLTKGPLGLLLGSLGLISRPWRAAGVPRPAMRQVLPGLGAFILLTGGWLLLAFYDRGEPVLDKLLGKELVGHVVSDAHGHAPLQQFWKPAFYFVTRFLPWSLLAVAGLWRVFRRPAAGAEERAFERYLGWYFVLGLAIFSVATHQRSDLMLPLVPAAAILVGREADRLLGRKSFAGLVAAAAIGLVLAAVWCFVFFAKHEPVVRTEEARSFAAEVAARSSASQPVLFVDTPMGMQFFLGRHQPTLLLKDVASSRPSPGTLIVAPGASMAALREAIRGLPRDSLVAWPKAGTPAWEAVVVP